MTSRRSSDTPRLEHVPGLDGLRGLAVAAVVAFHAGVIRGGYLGVDLFFVLSGFLITSLLLVEGRGGSISLGRFWGRRARRLLPALAVTLVGVAAYARFAADPAERHRIRWDGLATMAYVANWRDIFAHTNYWDLFTAPSPLEHTWSLAIEEQFYLCWPLIVFAAVIWSRRGRPPARLARTVTWLSATLAVVSAIWALGCETWWGWNRVYYGTDTRAVALLLGAFVAGRAAGRAQPSSRAPRWTLEGAGLLGVCTLALAWWGLSGGSWAARHGGLVVCSVAAAIVIAVVAHPVRGPITRAVSFAPFRWLGLISYGVYLYHWPIMVWLNADRVPLGRWTLLGVQVTVTLIVSVCSYFLIEQPIRQRRWFGQRRNAVGVLGAFGLLVVVVIAATAGYQTPEQAVESTPRAAPQAARFGPRIMVTGNSVAWYLTYEGLYHLESSPQFALSNQSSVGCGYPGSDSAKYDNGQSATRTVASCNHGWARAAQRFHPDVVLYLRDGFEAMSLHHDGRYLDVCSVAFHDWYRDVLEADARSYARVGAKLALVTSLPTNFRVWLQPQPAGIDRAVGCGNAVLRDVARSMPDDVILVDLEGHLCGHDGHCVDEIDGQRLRPDGVHFKGRPAITVARWILDQIGIRTRVVE